MIQPGEFAGTPIMLPGDYVRATKDIAYDQHGAVKKGELGMVLELSQGGYHVRWLQKHRRMADWRNQSYVEASDIDPAAAPMFRTLRQEIAIGAIATVLLFMGWLTPPPGHHWLFRATGRQVERVYVEHAPHFVERVVVGADGKKTWLVSYERIKGRYVRVAGRRELTTQDQIDEELRRLDEP
jgi:hypothetical protein